MIEIKYKAHGKEPVAAKTSFERILDNAAEALKEMPQHLRRPEMREAPAVEPQKLSDEKMRELRKAHDVIADIQIEMLKERYPDHEWHPLFLIRGRLHEWLYLREGNKS